MGTSSPYHLGTAIRFALAPLAVERSFRCWTSPGSLSQWHPAPVQGTVLHAGEADDGLRTCPVLRPGAWKPGTLKAHP